MAQSFRVFGGELGEVEGYIDCDVVGVGNGDTLLLERQSDGNKYRIDIDRLSRLRDENLAYDLSEVDTNKEVWDAIDALETSFVNSNANDKSHYIEAAKTLFSGA